MLDLFTEICYNSMMSIRNISIHISEVNMTDRVSKENYYLDIAQTVAERCTCMRKRFGSIIVKNDVILSTGYNGAPPRTSELH